VRGTSPIRIQSAPKLDQSGAHRTVSAEATWERLRPLLKRIGITRLADITGLDRLGIPTYSAVRPTLKRSAVTVTCGKGLRSIDAKVGAVMESIEYKLSEPDEHRSRLARIEELEGNVAHPADFHLPPWVKNVSSLNLEWVEAWDIARDEPVWLPAASAFILDPGGDFLFDTDSNGVASGNRIEEAICHALAEIIERDAESVAQSHLALAPASERYPLLDLSSIPASSQALVERFVQNGVDLYVRNITSDLGIACFSAECVDRNTDKLLIHGGSGAHLVAEIALNRALTEAAQSRAADIQGSREDLSYFRRADRDPRNLSIKEWRAPEGRRAHFRDVPSLCCDDVAKDIGVMIERLLARGFKRVAVFDLTSDELGIPAVRVIVPGLEIFCVDRWRTGPRLAQNSGHFIEERWST
jgi:putative methanogenesis marker protein 1